MLAVSPKIQRELANFQEETQRFPLATMERRDSGDGPSAIVEVSEFIAIPGDLDTQVVLELATHAVFGMTIFQKLESVLEANQIDDPSADINAHFSEISQAFSLWLEGAREMLGILKDLRSNGVRMSFYDEFLSHMRKCQIYISTDYNALRDSLDRQKLRG